MPLQLQGLSGSLAGQVITFPPNGGVIGRGSACTVVLADDLASRQHAPFEPAGAGWTVADLGSTNGTRVNGRPIPPQQPVPLQPGDEVQIGDSVFLVVLVASCRRSTGSEAAHWAWPQAAWRNGRPWPGRPRWSRPASRPLDLDGPAAGGAGRYAAGGRRVPALAPGDSDADALRLHLGEQTAMISGMQGFGPLTLAIGALLLLVVLLDVLLRSGSRWPGVVILLLGWPAW